MANRTETASVVLELEAQGAESTLKRLDGEISRVRASLVAASKAGDTKGVKALSAELRALQGEQRGVHSRADALRTVMKRLDDAKPKELRRTMKELNRALESDGVKRGSKEWDAYREALARVREELKLIREEGRLVESELAEGGKSLGERFRDFGVSLFSLRESLSAMGRVKDVVMGLVNDYASLDEAMIGTQKFAGLTREEVESLNRRLVDMGSAMPIEKLHEMAQAAGRLGIEGEDALFGYVKSAEKVLIAMDELGDEAPEVMMKLAGIFDLTESMGTEQAMLSVGSAINSLGASCAASTPNLVEFAGRLGAVANSTDMTMSEMLAFGAVLDDQNVSMEKSSTALQSIITKMYANTADFAAAMRVPVEELNAALKRSSTEGLMMFVESLQDLDKQGVAKVLTDLKVAGQGNVQTINTLVGNIDMLKEKLEESNRAFEEATSVDNEAATAMGGVSYQMEQAEQQMRQLRMEIGAQLAPMVLSLTSSFNGLLRGLFDAFGGAQRLVPVIKALVVAYASYKATVLAATVIQKANTMALTLGATAKTVYSKITKSVTVATKAQTAATESATAAQIALNAAQKASGWGALVSIIGLGVSLLTDFFGATDKATEKMDEMKDKTDELKETQQELGDVQKNVARETSRLAAEEKQALDELYESATNEADAMNRRIEAARRLQELYPAVFGNFSAEDIALGKAKKGYDALTQSILANAQARAAAAVKQRYYEKMLEKQVEYRQLDAKRKALMVINGDKNNKWGGRFTNPTNNFLVEQKDREEYMHDYGIYTANNKELKNLINQQQVLSKEVNALDADIKVLDAMAKSIKPEPVVEDVNPAAFSGAGAGGGGSKGGGSKSGGRGRSASSGRRGKSSGTSAADEKKKREERAKGVLDGEELRRKLDELEALEADAVEAYRNGEMTYSEYLAKSSQAHTDFYDAQLKALEDAKLKETTVYSELLKERDKEVEKYNKEILAVNEAFLKEESRERMAQIERDYIMEGDYSEQAQRKLSDDLYQEELNYLLRRRELHADDVKEMAAIDAEIREKELEHALDKERDYAEKLKAFRQEYAQETARAQMDVELAVLDELYAAELIKEEEYNKLREKILNKYSAKDVDRGSEYYNVVKSMHDSITALFSKSEDDTVSFVSKVADGIATAVQVAQMALQSLSSLMSAERDEELAKTEASYDAQIKAAADSSARRQALEEQKERALAKIKKKYNERAMRVELAQAVASTALAAINAYASAAKQNWILGAVAAALATAFGAMQIATIKKQHTAEAAGYYSGGYTGRRASDLDEAGVVHANEFVATARAVRNPAIRPVLDLIDYAQRNNTISTLSRADVAAAVGVRAYAAPGSERRASAPAPGVKDAGSSQLVETLGNLDRTLSAGIPAYVILDGERGLHRKYEHYKSLNENASGR